MHMFSNIRRSFTQIKNSVIPNLIWNLQRLSLINNPRGRSRIKYGMTPLCHNDGFTLVELLVVVLIVGILAAVALPQYQLTVTRSRFATLKNLTTSLVKAQEVYYLTHDRYAENYTDLDIQLPFQTTEGIYGYFEGGSCWMTLSGEGRANQVGCTDETIQMGYQQHLLHSTTNNSRKGCTARGTKDRNCSTVQCKVCQHKTGKTKADNSGTSSVDWTIWWYN